MTHRTGGGVTFMRMIVDGTSQFDLTNQLDAVVSRRSFLKSAAAPAVLGSASPQALMAETKEGMSQRAWGRTIEQVSAIGLGGYCKGSLCSSRLCAAQQAFALDSCLCNL